MKDKEKMIKCVSDNIAEFFVEKGFVVPPIIVGQKLYAFSHYNKSGVLECVVKRIIIDEKGILYDTDKRTLDAKKYGETFFVSKEFAENKLKSLNNP